MGALLGFLGTVVVVTTLIHLYLWKRLVRDTLRPGWVRRVGGFAVLALALAAPGSVFLARSGVPWLAWPGYLWIALMFYLLVVLLVLEVPLLVAKLVLRRRAKRAAAEPVREPALVGAAEAHDPDDPGLSRGQIQTGEPENSKIADEPGHDPDRRLLLARGAAIFAGLTAAGIVGYGVRTAFSPPRLDRVQIPLAKLPRSMDGFRIGLVSDIHLGPLTGAPHCERIVAAINGLDPDLVAVVGDLVDGDVAELGSAAAPLRDLRSRHGSYFVTGNHEYYSGHEQWVEELARLGVRPLRNQRLAIGGLDLAGVNDLAGDEFGDGPDFAAALGGRDPAKPVVLLAHQPVQVHEAARHGVDLQLSGHTHGGQMIPFGLVVRLAQPLLSGLAEIDGTRVYVTNGAGFWGPPVRVGVPPEITLVELRTQ